MALVVEEAINEDYLAFMTNPDEVLWISVGIAPLVESLCQSTGNPSRPPQGRGSSRSDRPGRRSALVLRPGLHFLRPAEINSERGFFLASQADEKRAKCRE
jgi:hypothetical protein